MRQGDVDDGVSIFWMGSPAGVNGSDDLGQSLRKFATATPAPVALAADHSTARVSITRVALAHAKCMPNLVIAGSWGRPVRRLRIGVWT